MEIIEGMRKSFTTLFFAFCICVLIGGMWYLLGTNQGSRSVADKVLKKLLRPRVFAASHVSGTLLDTLVYEGVILKGVNKLPSGSNITVKRLEVSLSLKRGLSVKVHNGTAEFPYLEPVLFYGAFQDGDLDVNAYTRSISVEDFCEFWSIPTMVAGENIFGTIDDVDLYFTGKPFQPLINGTFSVEKLARADISFTKGEGVVDVTLKARNNAVHMHGVISLNGGVISNPRSASVSLQDASFIFSGKPEDVSMKVKGMATVEQVKIFASLEGTFDKPELRLTSEPMYSQDRLLVMLATNKVWSSFDQMQAQNQISSDAVKDFLDYFVLGGAGKKLSNSLGVSDVSLTFQKDKKGISLKKDITNSVGATYAVEQKSTKEGTVTNTQKVGGEYKITEGLSVGAQKDVLQSGVKDTAAEQVKPEQKVYLKYKTTF